MFALHRTKSAVLHAAPPSAANTRRAEWALAGGCLALLLLATCMPTLPLAEGYHDFADQRTLWGLPYAMDVLTNLPFALMGGWGFWALWRARSAGISRVQQALAALLMGGLVVTAASSGYYHASGPDDAGLFVDRLGMCLAFAGMLGLAAADRISARAGCGLAAFLLLAAPASAALHWQTGNMAPWAVLQGGSLLLLALLAVRRPLPGALGFSTLAVVGFYAVAKALEMADAPVFALTQHLLSGHSAKHVAAALAAWPVVAALRASSR